MGNTLGKRFTPDKKSEYYIKRTDDIKFYLNSIESFDVMSPDEERACIKEYKETKDVAKRNFLVSCNQRYVYAIAKRFTTNPEIIIDLINEGNLGLIEAIEKYDLTFATNDRNSLMMYATSYVMRNMVNFFILNKTVVRKVDLKMGNRISEEKNRFFAKNGRYPTDDELREIFMEKYGKNFKDNYAVEQSTIVSIDDTSPYDDSTIFNDSEEFNERTSSENDYLRVMDEDTYRHEANAVLSKLSERDQQIMKMLFGFGGVEYSPDQIAMKYGLSKTRVLQIKRTALAKMRA